MTAPYMQFYPGDYLSDTMHLSIEEHGAYLKIMFCMWQAGGWLTDNDRDVCRILGITNGKWQKIKYRIGSYFFYENGRFTQQKLQKTLKKSEEKRSILKSNGSEGGKAKALKDKKTTLANATNLPYHRTRVPEPEPIPEIFSVDKSTKNITSRPKDYTVDFEIFWELYPKNSGSKRDAAKSYHKAITKGANHENIIRSVTDYRSYLERSREYSKHASTWLNSECWEIEYRSLDGEKPFSNGAAKTVAKSKWTSAAEQIIAEDRASGRWENS